MVRYNLDICILVLCGLIYDSGVLYETQGPECSYNMVATGQAATEGGTTHIGRSQTAGVNRRNYKKYTRKK